MHQRARFQTAWSRACKAAGLVGLTFHDLRGTAVTRLAIAGATEAEIAIITGHSLQRARDPRYALSRVAIRRWPRARSRSSNGEQTLPTDSQLAINAKTRKPSEINEKRDPTRRLPMRLRGALRPITRDARLSALQSGDFSPGAALSSPA
jgi:hypothetical protein